MLWGSFSPKYRAKRQVDLRRGVIVARRKIGLRVVQGRLNSLTGCHSDVPIEKKRPGLKKVGLKKVSGTNGT